MKIRKIFLFVIFALSIIVSYASAGVTTITTDTIVQDGDEWYGWENRVEIRDEPIVTMIGGHADFIHSYNTSVLNMSGGEIQRFRSYGSSVLNISDNGLISVFAVAWNSSQVNINGGHVGEIYGRNISVINIISGVVSQAGAEDSSVLNISGGVIEQVYSQGEGVANLSGGEIATIESYEFQGEGGPVGIFGIINIYGDDLFATNTGGAYGYGFITGDWQDGIPFSIDLGNENTYDRVVLIPEPTTLMLLVLGSLVFHTKYKT